MKEIKITCPKCKEVTIYYRDNINFYLKVIWLFMFGVAVGATIIVYI